ncbi:biotin--[acetyl-CoA-carboxylase] ligase [Amnibacterium flavum]|uniref:biotin--[biotin carboxyl-carrier protein] ligase n=1 Tax=Amnibacterium flavum TaxID=2173173 RepID=A0A2V1HTA7_9MICO|nr:biotin--[acetyl-CoA-carboxylase] ligase [Amnibacterium flavum]PVZ95836.1 biotin--[acetyl-CoA-carboxylase] ligase [Amnibacterium flavum]
MELPRSRAASNRLEWLASAASTNDELTSRAVGPAAAEWPGGSVIATDTQTAGRGRLGRVWTAPAGTSLAASVLVRPDMPVAAFGWLPLIAGAAMTRALRALGADAELKWPNDVLIGGRKVCGILSELLPDLTGAVVGAGVNISISADDLPVDTATSLIVEGVDADIDSVLGGFLEDFLAGVASLAAAGGDADAGGIRSDVAATCGTIGRAVRVIMPDGEEVLGEATGIDSSGRLEVARGDARIPLAVSAGDVTHLRY